MTQIRRKVVFRQFSVPKKHFYFEKNQSNQGEKEFFSLDKQNFFLLIFYFFQKILFFQKNPRLKIHEKLHKKKKTKVKTLLNILLALFSWR